MTTEQIVITVGGIVVIALVVLALKKCFVSDGD
jgi:hypothetical protein